MIDERFWPGIEECAVGRHQFTLWGFCFRPFCHAVLPGLRFQVTNGHGGGRVFCTVCQAETTIAAHAGGCSNARAYWDLDPSLRLAESPGAPE